MKLWDGGAAIRGGGWEGSEAGGEEKRVETSRVEAAEETGAGGRGREVTERYVSMGCWEGCETRGEAW